MSTQTICLIPGNSDIAGIGVRISVYIQACLAALNSIYTSYIRFPGRVERANPASQASAVGTTDLGPQGVPLTYFLQRSFFEDIRSNQSGRYPIFLRTNRDYLDMIKVLERGLFMVGAAVVISAFLEASLTGLTPYHALILLNISQINNWSGFILLLSGRGFGLTENRDGGWIRDLFSVTKESWILSIPWFLHSAMMSAFGLYFWSDLKPFLKYASDTEEGCQPLTYLWLFGSISVSNNTLRISSLVYYAISAFPIIGLYFLTCMLMFAIPMCLAAIIIPVVLALVLLVIVISISILLYRFAIKPVLVFIFQPLFRTPFIQKVVALVRRFISRITIPRTFLSAFYRQMGPFSAFLAGLPYNRSVLTIYLGIHTCTPLVYMIVSTELTVRVNRPNVERGAEARWTYGQTLAIFTALVSLALYVLEVGKLIIKQRRRKPMRNAGKGGKGDTTENPVGDSESLTSKPRPLFVERDTQTDSYREWLR